MQLRAQNPCWKLIAGAVLVGGLSACYIDASDDKESGHGALAQTPDAVPQQLLGRGHVCDDRRTTPVDGSALACWQNDDYTWRTSCRSGDCQDVKVFTHYMLPDELPGQHVVHVEAFDNEHFQGAPVSTVRIGAFSARRGEWRDADLYLEPGEYFIRAYMTTDDDTSVPYELGGMKLVGDQPVGVYGALASAESVRVEPRVQNPYPAPVHIYLDKLFQKPGSEPDTNAHLRINLSVESGAKVPDRRLVRIELRTTADLTQAPAYTFETATETLLVQGREGKVEFVSPSLKEGDYLVFVYIDTNGNKLFDEGELSQLYKVNQQPAAVPLRQDHTETIAMTLAGGSPAPGPSTPPAPK